MSCFSKEMMNACNKTFGTKVKTKDDFNELFDIYETEKEFEENFGEPFSQAKFYDTAEEVNGKYVYFNEINYDWKTGKSTLFSESSR